MLKAGIVGITGYAGVEIYRLLKHHPEVDDLYLVSHSKAGQDLSDVYPQFAAGSRLEKYDLEKLKKCDIVFTALPHGVSQDRVAELRGANLKVIDLSGDFRYKNQSVYEKWYNQEHRYPELLQESVYGLVELNREQLQKADLIANPGCYPTVTILGLYPLLKKVRVRKGSIIVDAKSGISGAGSSPGKTTHYCEIDENVRAYGIGIHRHTSEIEKNMEYFTGLKDLKISFTPHLVPMKRGILSTIYADIDEDISEKQLKNYYQEIYGECEFIDLLEGDSPDTKHVYASNYCQIGINFDTRTSRAVVVSAIDNLGKGAASQAVQNMNVMFSFAEKCGLESRGIFP